MGIVFKNNAKTTLASSLSNSATSATVTDGSVFPSLSAGEFFLVTFDDGSNNEICKCTARSGNTLTIVRAQESTTARAFSSGDAAEGRVTAGVLETIQENIAAKSANQTVFNTTTSGGATTYNIGTNPGVEANAMVFLNGVLQHHDTLSFSGTNLTFDAAPANGLALEVIIDNLINLQSSNLTVDSFTAADVSGSPQTDFTLSDTPAAETNLIVFIDGVFQDQDAYTISSNTLTITTGVIAGRGVTVYVINPVNIGTPSDSTVTSAKLSGNITMPGTLTVGSNDVAFDSPTFVVDNANSRVGLGTASPSVPVDIVGDVKMSADLTVDTSTLKVDSSNNRVGVGTASPSVPLHVSGEAYIDSYLSLRTTDDQANRWLLYTHTNDNLEINYNGAGNAEVVIDTSGNVGVGTTSPSSFHSSVLPLIVGSGSGDEGMAIFSGSSNKGKIGFADTAEDGNGSYRGYLQYDHSGDNLNIGTAGSEKLRISGNNLHLNGGTDARIQLGSGGAGANQVSNNTVHIRGDGADAKYMAASGGVHIFEINGSEIKRITTSGVTYATGGEVRQHYATDNGSNKRYTAPLNPQIAQVGLQGYWDPTKATDGTDFSPSSHGNGNQDLTLASGVSHGTNSNRAYWSFDGTSNAYMYGNPNLSAYKSSSFSVWVYWNDVTSLNGGYQLNGIQIGNHYMYIGIVQGANDSAPLYGYAGQGTNIPQGGSSASHEGAYVNSDEWVYLTIQSGHGSSDITSRTKGRSEVYLNGALVQRRSEIALPTVAANGSSSFYLGRVQGGYYLNGLIGPAVLYERTLHQWEILENMRVHADMYMS